MTIVTNFSASGNEPGLAVTQCARCGENHDVKFSPFSKNNIECDNVEYTHWGLCPITKEPVIMAITHEEQNGTH